MRRRAIFESEGAAEFLPPTPSFRRTRADFGKRLRNCVSNFGENGFEPYGKDTPIFCTLGFIRYVKFLAIVLLVSGEALSIYAEMIGARTYAVTSHPVLSIFWKMFLLITIAGGFLIAGYMLGFRAFKNIWIVSVASITSILIIEPLLAYAVFAQLPTKGAVIGFILGLAGFVAAIFFK